MIGKALAMLAIVVAAAAANGSPPPYPSVSPMVAPQTAQGVTIENGAGPGGVSIPYSVPAPTTLGTPHCSKEFPLLIFVDRGWVTEALCVRGVTKPKWSKP